MRALLASVLVAVSVVASGTLECSHRELTATEVRGQSLYGRMCVVCHGANGEGYRADQATALAHPDFLRSVTDSSLRYAIANGRTGTTMSAWATARGGPLPVSDVDAVVAYLRTWQRDPPLRLDERPSGGNALRGKEIYARECARCHGAEGIAGPNVGIGNPQFLANATHGFLRHAIAGGRAGTAMPSFKASLGDEGVEDVVAFVRSFQWGSRAQPKPAPSRPPPIPLGPVPLNPHGPEPRGFSTYPANTHADLIHAEYERGARMAFLDARAPSDYANEHIAGAVSVPFYEPDPYFTQLPKDAWLVCYCGCPHAESGMLAQKLRANGFTKVTVLDEGLPYWRGKKWATETGVLP